MRRNRFVVIFTLTILASATVVFIQDCSQQFDEPYNKGYQPMDKARYHMQGQKP